jgi:hypothetical protein
VSPIDGKQDIGKDRKMIMRNDHVESLTQEELAELDGGITWKQLGILIGIGLGHVGNFVSAGEPVNNLGELNAP